jgi:hypothetical protein
MSAIQGLAGQTGQGEVSVFDTTFKQPPRGSDVSPKLAAKLLRVMSSLGWIEKGGSNTAQNYKYVQADDVAAEVRKVLAEHGVALAASVLSVKDREVETGRGTKMHVSQVLVGWTFIDTESGASFTSVIPGEAMDAGDKAIYKAMTGSLKYAMKMNFLIPTGEDPEEAGAHEEVYKDPPRAKSSPEKAPEDRKVPRRKRYPRGRHDPVRSAQG